MNIEMLYQQFPDIHPNILLKTELLRQGIDLSESAIENFRHRDDLSWKGFHLFSYDFKKTKVERPDSIWSLKIYDLRQFSKEDK